MPAESSNTCDQCSQGNCDENRTSGLTPCPQAGRNQARDKRERGSGEKAIFSKPARWMDYSGPITNDAVEGITWFDHPSNPRYPSSWHVRDDGWMSPAFCLRDAFTLERARPLRLRYGWHLHSRALDANVAEKMRKAFAEGRAWEVVKAKTPWRVWLQRAGK